ncbi:hypothetical protein [Comamonas aquatica]|uniref:hypothetical protein n=1 Tax=Comamonas aquatica TaxID=225991 RepID=UPI002449A28E|nr:hypothetical protein [Comamonas aquatica]MDH1675968.1 hypothetical protein [Comamonas aquatica]MDH1679584.1 hypothetical protein [Comamonas aquatica]
MHKKIQVPDLEDANGKPHTLADDVTSTTAGLFFIGYVNPVSGQLREIGRQAPRVAKAVRDHLRNASAKPQTENGQPLAPVQWPHTNHP